jgi:hypothetical protein
MLESLIFMILSFIGIMGLIISVITLLVGIIKKSRKVIKVGIGIGIVPILCFGLIALWYMFAIPSFNKSELKDFSGTYFPHKSAEKVLKENGLFENKNRLILKSNGRYLFDSIPGIGLHKSGKWKTGGIDGLFIFYDNNDKQIEFGSPSGSGMDCGISFQFQPNEDDFFGTESIYFKKTESE